MKRVTTAGGAVMAAGIVGCALAASPAMAADGAQTTEACKAALTAANVHLPASLDPEKSCAALVESVATTLKTDVPGAPARLIIYSEEAPKFYGALSKSLRKYGGKSPVTVRLTDAGGPVVTMSNIQAAAAPEYREIGLGVWLDRIQDSGGRICKEPNEGTKGLGVLAPYAFEFFAKTVVPVVIKTYKAATAYKPARKVEAVVVYTPTGPAKDRITEIRFVPRGSTGGCNGG